MLVWNARVSEPKRDAPWIATLKFLEHSFFVNHPHSDIRVVARRVDVDGEKQIAGLRFFLEFE